MAVCDIRGLVDWGQGGDHFVRDVNDKCLAITLCCTSEINEEKKSLKKNKEYKPDNIRK